MNNGDARTARWRPDATGALAVGVVRRAGQFQLPPREVDYLREIRDRLPWRSRSSCGSGWMEAERRL